MFRVRVSNFSPDFNKSEFVELVNTRFSDVKSIDFQPRYNEKGRLYGCHFSLFVMHRFVTFSSEIGYDECLHMETFQFGDDLVKIEPSQDKGCMPTSVTPRPSLVRVDDPRFVQSALLPHTGPV